MPIKLPPQPTPTTTPLIPIILLCMAGGYACKMFAPPSLAPSAQEHSIESYLNSVYDHKDYLLRAQHPSSSSNTIIFETCIKKSSSLQTIPKSCVPSFADLHNDSITFASSDLQQPLSPEDRTYIQNTKKLQYHSLLMKDTPANGTTLHEASFAASAVAVSGMGTATITLIHFLITHEKQAFIAAMVAIGIMITGIVLQQPGPTDPLLITTDLNHPSDSSRHDPIAHRSDLPKFWLPITTTQPQQHSKAHSVLAILQELAMYLHTKVPSEKKIAQYCYPHTQPPYTAQCLPLATFYNTQP